MVFSETNNGVKEALARHRQRGDRLTEKGFKRPASHEVQLAVPSFFLSLFPGFVRKP